MEKAKFRKGIKALIFVVFFIVLSSPVFSAQAYIFTDPATDGTINTSIWATSGSPSENSSGILLNSAGENIIAKFGNITADDDTSNITLVWKWLNPDTGSADTKEGGFTDDASNPDTNKYGSLRANHVAHNTARLYYDNSNYQACDITAVSDNDYIRITWNLANNNIYMYRGDTFDNVSTQLCSHAITFSNAIVPYFEVTGTGEVAIADIYFYNESQEVVNNTISITNVIPTDATYYNTTTVNFTATIDSNPDFNITLYIDGVLNETKNYTGGDYVNISFLKVLNWGNHTFYFNISNNETTENNSNANFYIGGQLNISGNNHGGNPIENFSIYKDGVFEANASGYSHILTGLPNNTVVNITFDNSAFERTSQTITTNLTMQNLVFSLYTTNSISFWFRDDTTKELIAVNTTIDVEIISDTNSSNHSTINATLYVDLLTPENYTIRYDADGYLENFYYFTMTDRTHSNITVYLVNESIGSNITAIVYDNFNQLLEDVYIYVQKFNINTNAYELVGMGRTNFEGETTLTLVKNVEFYKFLLYYPLGTLREETSPTYIYDNTITFTIDTGADVGDAFFNMEGVDYTLVFNNQTNNFRFVYNDPDATISEACLKVYQKDAFTDSLINESCLSTTSGTILGGVTATNGTTYIGKAFVYFGTTEEYLASLEKTFFGTSRLGALGLLLVMILTIIMAFTSIYSVSLASVVTPIPLLICAVIGIINFSVPIAIGIQIGGVILAIMLYRAG